MTIIVDICIIYSKMWWNKLNFLSFSKHKKDEEEKCPYEKFIEEQEETLKKYENKKDEEV